MIKKIVLGILLGFIVGISQSYSFLSSGDSFYYGDNKFTYYFDHNGARNGIFDINDNLIDSIPTIPYQGNLYYDGGLSRYYFKVYDSVNHKRYLINTDGTYSFIGNDPDWRANFYNGVSIPNSSNPAMSGYYRVGYEQVVGNKPLHYNFDNGFTFYLENDTGGIDSLSFGSETTYDRMLNLSGSLTSFIEFLPNSAYKYHIFDGISNLKYSSPSFTLPGGPNSCSDFLGDQMMYDECNMYGFSMFCDMDMYGVCGGKPKLKYNGESKIVVENKISSFSEENSYLQSLIPDPNQNIEGSFTDTYVWNSDLLCRVYTPTNGTTPTCSGRLIRNGTSLYCNPNLTHYGVTYSSSYFPYYETENSINYECGAVISSGGTAGSPGPTGPTGPQGPAGSDGADGQDGIDGTNGIDGIDGTDGLDGISCWDTNINRLNDPGEDINNDGFFNTLDCYGTTGIDGKDGIDGTNGIDGMDGQNGLNGETIETLSDDTKGFWESQFDSIKDIFSVDENSINDLKNSLSGALQDSGPGFSVGSGGTSGINYIPGDGNYGNILNSNSQNLTCDMFNSDGSFAYYSNGSYDLSIDLNGLLDLSYADKVPFLEELLFLPNKILSFITNPLQNIFSTLRVFGGIGEKTYCYFGTLQDIEYQKHLKVGTSFLGANLIFTPGTMTIIDYLILFFLGLPLLLITVRILLY